MFVLLDAPEIVSLPQRNFAAAVIAEFFFTLLYECDSGWFLSAAFGLFSLQKHKHV